MRCSASRGGAHAPGTAIDASRDARLFCLAFGGVSLVYWSLLLRSSFLPLERQFPAPKQNRSEPAEEGVGLKAISPERAGKCPRPARVEGTSAQARKLAEPAQNDGRWFAVEVWIFEHSGAPATAPPRSACGIPVGRAPEHCGAGLQALRASRRRRRTISAHWQGPSTACGTGRRPQCFRP